MQIVRLSLIEPCTLVTNTYRRHGRKRRLIQVVGRQVYHSMAKIAKFSRIMCDYLELSYGSAGTAARRSLRQICLLRLR